MLVLDIVCIYKYIYIYIYNIHIYVERLLCARMYVYKLYTKEYQTHQQTIQLSLYTLFITKLQSYCYMYTHIQIYIYTQTYNIYIYTYMLRAV